MKQLLERSTRNHVAEICDYALIRSYETLSLSKNTWVLMSSSGETHMNARGNRCISQKSKVIFRRENTETVKNFESLPLMCLLGAAAQE